MFEKVNPMHPEVWKDVEGFEGHYQVSNHGRVRSIKKEILVLKEDYPHNGYKRVYLWKDGRKHNKLVHRLVAIVFLQNPNSYSDVNHIDEDKTNNRVNNLQWCTHLYNMNFGSVREKYHVGTEEKGHLQKQGKNFRTLAEVVNGLTMEYTKNLLRKTSRNRTCVMNGL